MHAPVCAAFPRQRTDQRLAAVIEELHTETRLQLAAQRRRERLRGREADPVAQIAARIETESARRVEQVREEARRAGVHGGAELLGELHLQLARPGAAVDHDAAVLLEGAMEA